MMRLIIHLLLCANLYSTAAAEPTVQLPNGVTVSGITTIASDGSRIHTFRGIPYAEPPIGPNRWRQSKLKRPSGAVNATVFGNVCPGDVRYDPMYETFPRSEDCLFLNVFAPATTSPTSKLPVMVWIHGGAFVAGSSNSYDGTNLAGKNVVVVTLNYRLGVLGFLSNDEILQHGDGANFGLRDQEVAFEWVKAYIGQFGGDPENITAFGESAGAMSVAMHMISREGGQQLFQKGIMESGAYTLTHDTKSHGQLEEYAKILIASVGCADSHGSSTMECLRQVSTEALVAVHPDFTWRPTVDGVFLYDVPIRRVLAGKISPVPTLIGVNTDDGWLFTYGFNQASQFDTFLRVMYPLMAETEYSRVAELYPADAFASPHHRVAEIFGDVLFVCPSEAFSLVLASRPNVPTYRYRYNHSVMMDGFRLVPHTFEMAYVFNSTVFPFPDALPTDDDSKAVVATIQDYWVNFAANANPNGDEPQMRTSWPQFSGLSQRQLVLQPTVTEETMGVYMHHHEKRCAFWRSVDLRIASEVAFSGHHT